MEMGKVKDQSGWSQVGGLVWRKIRVCMVTEPPEFRPAIIKQSLASASVRGEKMVRSWPKLSSRGDGGSEREVHDGNRGRMPKVTSHVEIEKAITNLDPSQMQGSKSRLPRKSCRYI